MRGDWQHGGQTPGRPASRADASATAASAAESVVDQRGRDWGRSAGQAAALARAGGVSHIGPAMHHARAKQHPLGHLTGFTAERAVLAALVAVAFVLRLFRLTDDPPWVDELLTWRRASLAWPDLVADSFHARHYPTYFTLVRLGLPLFGNDLFALRLPSAAFGAAAVVPLWLAARALAGPAAGFAAGLAAAASPFLLTYGQEARPYALALLFVAAALAGQLLIARDGATAGRSAFAAWSLGTAGALVTINGSALWLLASLAAFAVQLAHARRSEAGRLVRRAAPWLALALRVWLPFLPPMAGSVAGSAAGYWVEAPTLGEVLRGLAFVYAGLPLDPVGFEPITERAALIPIVALMLTAAVLGALALPPAPRAVLLAAVAVPPTVLLAAGAVLLLFVPRYAFAGAPAFLVLVAVGCAHLAAAMGRRPAARLRPAALALPVAFGLLLPDDYAAERKPRWDLVAEIVRTEGGEGVLFLDDLGRITVELLLAMRGDAVPALHSIHAGAPEDWEPALLVGGRAGQFLRAGPEAIAAFAAAQGASAEIVLLGRQVWVGAVHGAEAGSRAAPGSSG